MRRLTLLAAALLLPAIEITDCGATMYTCVKGGVINKPIPTDKEIHCLATTIFGESKGESFEGKLAVGFSAKNRIKNNKSICDVVLSPYQYSIFNDNPTLRAAALSEDLNPKTKNKIDEKNWEDSQLAAIEVLAEDVADPTKGATHYLAPKLMRILGYKTPKWARVYTQVAQIGRHNFYKKA